jgi:acetyl-CoA carboxylase carboxyl transferase subunit beta
MNWLSNFIRPKIRSFVGQKEVPDNLWQKCPECEGMLFHRDLEKNMHVCYHCGAHMKISTRQRLETLFDDGDYVSLAVPKVTQDPLKFRDRKRYSDRLRDAQNKTGNQDAIQVAHGAIGGQPAVIAVFDFDFMGGSMGAAVGEGIIAGAQKAAENSAAFIAIPASGGARMQEGTLSLMQMPRTIAAIDIVRRKGLPYIVLLTNPTTGGVSASFAMLGDIHIAEPGATIGFAGKRVIQDTIREQLPVGFQTSEYLLEHGMVDMVVKREDQPAMLGRVLDLLMRPGPRDGGYNGNNGQSRKNKSKNNGASKNRKSGTRNTNRQTHNTSDGSGSWWTRARIAHGEQARACAHARMPANTDLTSRMPPVTKL